MIKRKKIIIVSGGFDPVHKGHVRLMREAASHGDELFVILNNDNWLEKKKGYFFMDQAERKEILEAFNCVSKVIITGHKKGTTDTSVCQTLRRIHLGYSNSHQLAFANGGDRKAGNIPEYTLCEELGIEMIFNIGGRKIQSSSELIEKAGLL